MVKVKTGKLRSEEVKILAGITIATRKGTPIESTRTIEDVAQSIERTSSSEGFKVLTATDDKGNLVGWIYYYTAFPLMTFISGFYPVVESEDVALALIEASKRETAERGHTRLEIELVFPSDAHRAHSEKLVELYGKCDFQFAAEEIHMKSDLSTIELPTIDLPKGFTLRKFSEVSYDILESTGFRTLIDSKEGLFLSMSHAEQMVTLKYFFDKSRPYIDDASLILERDGEVVGFVITRIGDDGEPDIGPVGLVPEARGQGLGSYLLVLVLERLKASGSTSVYLDTTTTNDPAQKLYRKYGFKDIYYKQFYYWSP